MQPAVEVHKEASRSAPRRIRQDRQVEYLQDEMFGHLPAKLCSAKVAIGGCTLVDWSLQVQFPG